MPSLTSAKIFSGIICLCCIIYIILSINSSISLRNIVGKLRSRPWQTNVSIMDNTSKLLLASIQNMVSNNANLSTESYICDYVKTNNQHNKTNPLSFATHRLNALRRQYLSSC